MRMLALSEVVQSKRAGQNIQLAARGHGIARIKHKMPDQVLELAAKRLHMADCIGAVADMQTNVLAEQTVQLLSHPAHDVSKDQRFDRFKSATANRQYPIVKPVTGSRRALHVV